MFHQVHLSIASFAHDPDEDIIIHHSSKLVITPLETQETLHDTPREADAECSPHISAVKTKQTPEMCVDKLGASWVAAMRFWKRRKSAAVESFSSLGNWRLCVNDDDESVQLGRNTAASTAQRHTAAAPAHRSSSTARWGGRCKIVLSLSFVCVFDFCDSEF